MKMQPPEADKELHEQAIEFERIGNRAVRAAQERNRRLGVPNVYVVNGTIHYERPDGTLTTEDPYDEWQRFIRAQEK